MRAFRAGIRRLRVDQSGLSLAELLVAALLTSVMLIMVGNFFIQTAKLTTAGTQTRNSNGAAANIANEVTAVLRVATTLAKSGSEIPYPAIVSGTRSTLTIYSYSLNSYSSTSASDPAPVMVTFTLSSGTVSETRCTLVKSAGFWNPSTCSATSTRVLGSGVVAATGVADQLFTYRDGSGNPILIGTGGLLPAQLDDVSSIIVTVKVQADVTSKTPPVILSNTVVLRNLGLEASP